MREVIIIMNTMKKSKHIEPVWLPLVGIIIFAAIIVGIWSSYRQDSSPTDMSTSTTSTPATSTTSTTGARGPQTTNRANQSVVAVVQSLANDSRFAGLLSSTGVASLLTGPGPYTIFVPTNAAFGQLPAGTITKLNSTELKRFVEYHIVSGRAIDVAAELTGTIQALSHDALNFSFSTIDRIPMVNSAVLITEYKAKNGIVYLIDNVLIPPINR